MWSTDTIERLDIQIDEQQQQQQKKSNPVETSSKTDVIYYECAS